MNEDNSGIQQEYLKLKQSNEKLKEKVAEYESILDAVPFPIHVTNNDMRWIYMNRAFEKLLVDNHEITDRASAYGKPCSTANANICNTKNCGIHQLKTSGKDETFFDWHGASCKQTTAPVLDANGRSVGYVETVQDLTEVLNKVAHYQSILDALPFPIHVTDNEMRWIYMNPAFEKLLIENHEITDRESAYGKPCSTANASICKTKNCGINQLKTTGNNETYFDWHGASCKQTTAEIHDVNGKIFGYVESVQDLTAILKPQNYLNHEIEGLSKSFARIGEGDLTAHYDFAQPDRDTQQVYELLLSLRTSIRDGITKIRDNIQDINGKMTTLTATADTAASSIEDGSKGVQQIAQSTTKVSANAEKVAQGVDQIAKAMQDMSAAVEEITSNMESVSNLAKQANDLSHSGAALAGNAEKSMQGISTSTSKVYEIVSDVEKQMSEITKIVVIIRELANQTNLLALNAAIEAARAGDAGRGFAVVATEVKSLAQESRNSAERIEEMISVLTKSTQQASQAMDEARSTVEEGSGMVTETLHSFNKIADAVEKVTASTSEVAAATQEQAATTEEVTASVSEVSSLIEQTAKEAGDAAAATEESSAALDEITRMIENVDTIAKEAMEANRKFKVD